MPLLVQGPELGLNALVQENLLDPRAAAEGSQNLFYEFGLLRTPWGFAKLDLTTGLNSGDPVLAIFPYRELDGYDHIMAVTTETIQDHDAVNEEWDDKTQSGVTMASAIDTPISWATVGHDDTAIYLDDDSGKANAYHHIVVCNGGLGNIQRWTGRYETDFADVVGGGGYHGGTTHRAMQVAISQQNRMLLLSPQDFNASTNLWVKNNQQIRWPQINKLESWTGTGSGFVNLFDTGGTNVWSASLGAQYIIYQTIGIWTLNYVGGTTVFSPNPVIPDLGLLAPHLLISYDNVHYFIGTDMNVHAYFGGSVKQVIGDPIHKFLQADLDKQYKNRMWMVMGPNRDRLWIFIVESGSTFITKAYYRNMTTGKWGVRDFSSKFGDGTGITAVSLIGGQTYIDGDTYAEVLDTLSSYPGAGGGDLVTRYGDKLVDSSITLSGDLTTLGSWCDGGIDFTKGILTGGFSTDFTENDILKIVDGSAGSNVEPGTHFYTCYDVSSNGFSVRPRHNEDVELMEFNSGGTYEMRIGDTIDGTTSGKSAFVANLVVQGGTFSSADASGNLYLTTVTGAFQNENLNVGTNLNVATAILDSTLLGLVGVAEWSEVAGAVDVTGINTKAGHSGADAVFFSVCNDSAPGQTYRQAIEEIETQEQMLFGDATGLIYQVDETYTKDDDSLIDARHLTPVFDWGEIGKNKRWTGIRVVAEGTAGGAMTVKERISEFDTSDTGWTDFSFDLTAEMREKTFYTNKTSKRIQYMFNDWTGNQFAVREFEVLDPAIEENR